MAINEDSKLLRTWPNSKGTGVYELRVGRDEEVYCSCPGWKFSKERPRVCKHLKQWVLAVATNGQNLKIGA